MTRPSVLIVGGGLNQVPLVDEAKYRGFPIIVTDVNPNPPCKALADYFYQIDTTDRSETLRIARYHKIGAVMTDQSDAAIPTVAQIAAELKLPGLGCQTAALFTDKFLMRETLHKHVAKYSPIHFAKFSNKPSAIKYLRNLGEKLQHSIVKPTDSQGSKGVGRLSNFNWEQQVERAFSESRSGTIIIEEFVNGIEYSVDSVVVENHVTCLAIGRKEHFANNECLDQRIVFKASYVEEFRETLVHANREVILGLGLQTGLTHAEFIVADDRVLLVEVAARGGGSGISSFIVPHISKFETSKFLVDFATGLRPLEVNGSPSGDNSAILHFFKPISRVIKHVEIGPKARQLSRLFHIDFSEARSWDDPRDSRSRVGFFIVTGNSYQDARQMESAVLHSVRFVNDT